jgi:hypothetical protein
MGSINHGLKMKKKRWIGLWISGRALPYYMQGTGFHLQHCIKTKQKQKQLLY